MSGQYWVSPLPPFPHARHPGLIVPGVTDR
jgi:hypothetical protein